LAGNIFTKYNFRPANHWGKPPFGIQVYSKYFRRFADYNRIYREQHFRDRAVMLVAQPAKP
jgi:hypothetical protein